MKHLKTLNELFSTPKLVLSNIEEILEYLENFADENGYEIMKLHPMDISSLIPDITQKRITKEDPYGEEEWEVPKPKIISRSIKIFNGNKSVLGFNYTTNGDICSNELWIDKSRFNNVGINMIKKLIEE
jgi:hypothetical protein